MFFFAMVLVVPIGVMFAGAAWSSVFGWLSSGSSEPGQEGAGEPAAS